MSAPMQVNNSYVGEAIVLRGGTCVPLVVLQLVWRLEEAGVTLFLDERGRLIARPRELVSTADAELIRQNLPDVKRGGAYVAPEL